MSLRWRIALGLGVIAAVVSGLGAAGAYLATSHRLEASVDDSLPASVDSLNQFGHRDGHGDLSASTIEKSVPEGFARPWECPPAGSLHPAAAAQIVATDGTVTVCIEGGVSLPVDAEVRALAKSGGQAPIRTVTIDGSRYRLMTVSRDQGGAFEVARGLDEVDDLLGALQLRLGFIGAAGVSAAVLVGWLFARRIVRPVERLRRTAETIAQTQDLTTPVPTDGTAEIGSLAQSFTTMVGALATSRSQQRQLIRDASHELRTPLTSLRTNAELLGRVTELGSQEYEAVVESLQMEVGELTALVSELVELATNDTGADEPVEPVEHALLAEDVAARARSRSGRDIVVTRQGVDGVRGRPAMLTRAIANLVDNALKYSPSGSPVEIVIEGRRVEVRDHGLGIPDEDLAHVFDRFYRSTVTRTSPGSGLGLAIVKQAVERHGGRVWARNRSEGGAAVGFELAPPAV